MMIASLHFRVTGRERERKSEFLFEYEWKLVLYGLDFLRIFTAESNGPFKGRRIAKDDEWWPFIA